MIGKQMDNLWNKWKNELKKHGFKHDTDSMTRQLKENETIEYILCRHSEKLALGYAILKMDNNKNNKSDIILIDKNLRICADCHESIKLISKIERRIIYVHDAKCVHKFDNYKNGNCSCNDYY